MILELRTYDFAPGDAHRYLALFGTDGLSLITRHLPLAGYWLTELGPLNRLEHLWVYDDLGDRSRRRERLVRDVEWSEGFLPRGLPLIRRQQSRLLGIVAVSNAFERACREANRVHEAVSDGPVLRDGWLGLTCGPEATDDARALVVARIVVGGGVGQRLAIVAADDPACLGPVHEVLRPASFSPL